MKKILIQLFAFAAFLAAETGLMLQFAAAAAASGQTAMLGALALLIGAGYTALLVRTLPRQKMA